MGTYRSAMASPYRNRVTDRNAPRTLTFFHHRIALVAALALLACALSVSCTTWPRDVTLSCAPRDGPALECESESRSVWGRSRPLRVRVVPASDRPAAAALTSPSPRLDVDVEYSRRGRESWSAVRARYEHGSPVRLTDSLPTRFGDMVLRDLFVFREALGRGQRATLQYRSGWGGVLFFSMPGILLLVVFMVSGRTRLSVASDEGELTLETRRYAGFAPARRRLSLSEVEQALVNPEPLGARVAHRPALRLRDGQLVALTPSPFAAPQRALHIAARVAEFLQLPDASVSPPGVPSAPAPSQPRGGSADQGDGDRKPDRVP